MLKKKKREKNKRKKRWCALAGVKLNYVLKSQNKVIKFNRKTKRIASYIGNQNIEEASILLG